MKSRHKKLLLALNGTLLAFLAVVVVIPAPLPGAAEAIAGQPGNGGAANRQRGQYVMVSGRSSGSTGNVVYILDTVNREMVALKYNKGNSALEGVGYRNLSDDSKLGGGGR